METLGKRSRGYRAGLKSALAFPAVFAATASRADPPNCNSIAEIRLKAMLAVVLALGFAGFAYAECGATGCFGVYVEELYPEAQGGAWIRTSGTETLANCTADSGVYLRLSGTTPGYKEIYATLLAAQLADKKVSIRISEGSNPCSIAYVTLNRNNW